MEHIGGYAHKVTTALSFDDAIEKTTAALADAGFGVLTEIDVTATMKKKLDVDFKPYRILGACNPPAAHKALQTEPLIGVLLPCNVAVWDEGDHRVVASMDARMIPQVVGTDELNEMAADVNSRLEGVLNTISDMK